MLVGSSISPVVATAPRRWLLLPAALLGLCTLGWFARPSEDPPPAQGDLVEIELVYDAPCTIHQAPPPSDAENR